MIIEIQIEGEFMNLDSDRVDSVMDMFAKYINVPCVLGIDELHEIMQIKDRQFVVTELTFPAVVRNRDRGEFALENRVVAKVLIKMA